MRGRRRFISYRKRHAFVKEKNFYFVKRNIYMDETYRALEGSEMRAAFEHEWSSIT